MFGTKKKLMAAVVMLVISAIMMTSASYAWFTISTNPEIKGMKTQVVVNENLEIALAKTNADNPTDPVLPGDAAIGEAVTTTAQNLRQYTWGNIIDLDKVIAYKGDGTTTALDKTLRPAALTTGTPNKFQYPLYKTDGRLDKLVDLTESASTDGFGNITGESKVYGYYVDYWVRSNVGGNLTLNTTGVARSAGGETGLGSYFESNAASDADKILAANIFIAFKDITPAVTDKTTKAPTGSAPTAVKHKDGTPPTDAVGGKFKTEFELNTDNIVVLEPNKAKLIRMYVYLDGANVTNAAASIDGTTIGGSLNIQLGIAEVNNSMVVPTPADDEGDGEG